jgi:hypothetical protein
MVASDTRQTGAQAGAIASTQPDTVVGSPIYRCADPVGLPSSPTMGTLNAAEQSRMATVAASRSPTSLDPARLRPALRQARQAPVTQPHSSMQVSSGGFPPGGESSGGPRLPSPQRLRHGACVQAMPSVEPMRMGGSTHMPVGVLAGGDACGILPMTPAAVSRTAAGSGQPPLQVQGSAPLVGTFRDFRGIHSPPPRKRLPTPPPWGAGALAEASTAGSHLQGAPYRGGTASSATGGTIASGALPSGGVMPGGNGLGVAASSPAAQDAFRQPTGCRPTGNLRAGRGQAPPHMELGGMLQRIPSGRVGISRGS